MILLQTPLPLPELGSLGESGPGAVLASRLTPLLLVHSQERVVGRTPPLPGPALLPPEG